MRSLVAVTMLLLAGCDDIEGTMPDAGPSIDFFGEPCTAAPAPTFTICHDNGTPHNLGWCIDAPLEGGQGICRPQCGPDAVRCPAPGVMHYGLYSICYCAPT